MISRELRRLLRLHALDRGSPSLPPCSDLESQPDHRWGLEWKHAPVETFGRPGVGRPCHNGVLTYTFTARPRWSDWVCFWQRTTASQARSSARSFDGVPVRTAHTIHAKPAAALAYFFACSAAWAAASRAMGTR